MADGTGIGRVDKRVLRLVTKLQPGSPQPARSGVAKARQPTSTSTNTSTSISISTSTAAAVPAHLDDASQTPCPTCGGSSRADDQPSERENALARVRSEEADALCEACGRDLAAAHGVQHRPETTKARSQIEFVSVYEPSGKLDEATGTQVRAHVMRRYHQTRRKSQVKPTKTLGSTKKDLHASRPCRCAPNETCNACDGQTTRLMTILGSGRTDPFLALSVPNIPPRYHELIDYCMTVLWPGLGGVDYAVAYAREWLPIASQNMAVLNSFLFTASLHLETLRGPDSASRNRIRIEQLHHKGEAIRGINDALTDPQYCQSDELIQNMLFLAMNAIEDKEDPPDPSPFISPLQKVQWLDVYGNRSFIVSHVIAIQEMVRRRGGLRQIKSVGLPWLISFSELIFCAATLSKPQLPLLDPFGRDIVYQRLSIPDGTPVERSNQGFHYLRASGLRPDVIDIFLNLKDYSEAVDAHPNANSLPACMADNRSWLQHRLLSLPSAAVLLSQIDMLSEDFHSAMLCFEACRLSAVLYCVHVTFPVPRSMPARRLLLPQMKESISKIQLTAGDQALAELVFWCVVIGGIAAAGQPERSWFGLQLVTLSTMLGLRSWAHAKMVLRQFAWLESACNAGGTTFWNEVL